MVVITGTPKRTSRTNLRTNERQWDMSTDRDKALDAALAGFLQGFEVVIIQLDENDDAQEIFASLRTTRHDGDSESETRHA